MVIGAIAGIASAVSNIFGNRGGERSERANTAQQGGQVTNNFFISTGTPSGSSSQATSSPSTQANTQLSSRINNTGSDTVRISTGSQTIEVKGGQVSSNQPATT
ncbi:MAG: hypothetical protein SFU25_03040 [Candidatus Caenarcaniphilales bacterium]|nr:hypothetical protein [Candidatus Caenarcaniphilales bacterium]